MARKVRDVMTVQPVALPVEAPLTEAARLMRDRNVGDVLVTQGDLLCGVLTDRDIVVRAVASGRDPGATRLSDVCSAGPVTVSPEEDATAAARLMSEKAVRRVPVVERGRPVGIVTIGDLMEEGDAQSVISSIYRASPDR